MLSMRQPIKTFSKSKIIKYLTFFKFLDALKNIPNALSKIFNMPLTNYPIDDHRIYTNHNSRYSYIIPFLQMNSFLQYIIGTQAYILVSQFFVLDKNNLDDDA